MEFADQHREAIAKTVRVKNEVTAEIFDDKQRPMGTITVSSGNIAIFLESFPSMIGKNETGKFLGASIALGVEACWEASQQAFERV